MLKVKPCLKGKGLLQPLYHHRVVSPVPTIKQQATIIMDHGAFAGLADEGDIFRLRDLSAQCTVALDRTAWAPWSVV